MDDYQIRWSIEIFFRGSKQYLNLGKCKSTCFDAQIADATISLIQYTILSFHQRITEYGSFEGVFASALENTMQNSIAAELQKMFLILVEMFCEMAGIDIVEITGSVIKNEHVSKKVINLNPNIYQNLEKYHAA